MESTRWVELKATFEELVALGSATRSERLARLDTTDPELSHLLRQLLAADASADRLLGPLDPPPGEAPRHCQEGSDPFGLAGTHVAHFRVDRVVGCGGMGVVYRAEDTRLDRPVALKFLLPQYGLDPLARQRFLLEARTASLLDHPNICTIHEVGEAGDGRLYLAMSYYPGETLRDRLARDGPLGVDEALRLAVGIAAGLGAAHEAGVVHRDLKPGNLMLTARGDVRILDFGLAKIRDLSLTGSGERPGTVAYMSPEQLQGDAVDGRSDLWSLGAVLYQMLTGRTPFGDGAAISTAYRILHEPPTPPAELVPTLPDALGELVLGLLAKRPEARPASAAEVLEGVERLCEEATAPARTAGGAPGARPARRTGGTMTPLNRRSRGRLRVLAGGALIAVTGGALLLADRLASPIGATAGSDPQTSAADDVRGTRERILLAEFAAPPADTLAARIAGVALRGDLERAGTLALLDAEQVRSVLARMARPDGDLRDAELAREIAVREGIRAVLGGEIVRVGGGYLVSAHLTAAESGEVLVSERETAADSAELLPAIDRLSARLGGRVAESLAAMPAPTPLERVTTASLGALRKYSQAVNALEVSGDVALGLGLLGEAIALDTTFAAARLRLATALRERSPDDDRARVIDELNRALRYFDGVTERERYALLGHYHWQVTGERERAVGAMQSLLASHPDDRRALDDLASLFFEGGDWARAAEYSERAWRADSTAFAPLARLAAARFNEGRLQESLDSFDRLTARFPGNPRGAQLRVLAAAAREQYAAAESLAVAERDARPEDGAFQAAMAVRLAELALVRGRLGEADRHVAAADELFRQQRRAGSRAALALAYNRMLLRIRGPQEGERIQRFLETVDLAAVPVQDRPYLLLAGLHADVEQPERARELLAEWDSLAAPGIRQKERAGRSRLLAAIALADGRPTEALAELRRAGAGRQVSGQPQLGYLFERTGQRDSAIAVYERFLVAPDLHRLSVDAEWRGFVLQRLAGLHINRGNWERAAVHYGRLIELWRDADPELQRRVEEATRVQAWFREGLTG